MAPASRQALEGLRDLSMIKCCVIPSLACTFYISTLEIKKARSTGDWNVVFAGLTVFGMDFINETWNGWVLVFTQRSAFWIVLGETALRTMVGWNIEIWYGRHGLGVLNSGPPLFIDPFASRRIKKKGLYSRSCREK